MGALVTPIRRALLAGLGSGGLLTGIANCMPALPLSAVLSVARLLANEKWSAVVRIDFGLVSLGRCSAVECRIVKVC